MQQQHIVGSAFRKKILDLPLNNVGGLIPHHLYGEIADLGIAEHPAERLGVRARG